MPRISKPLKIRHTAGHFDRTAGTRKQLIGVGRFADAADPRRLRASEKARLAHQQEEAVTQGDPPAATPPPTIPTDPFLIEIRDRARARLEEIEQRIGELDTELIGLRLAQVDVARVLAASEGREFTPTAEEVSATVNALADATRPAPAPTPVEPEPQPEPPVEPEPQPEPPVEPEPETTPQPESSRSSDDSRPFPDSASQAITEDWVRDWGKDGRWFTPRDAADDVNQRTTTVRRDLAALTDAGILEQRGEGFRLEFRVKPAKAPQTPTPGRLPLTEEMVRDWVVVQTEPFSGAHAARELGHKAVEVNAVLRRFAERGLIRRPPGTPSTGRGARYEYIDPKSNGGPTHRPRKEPKIPASEAPARGTVVPNTRTIGRSGKPGLDKRRAAQGKRVQRSSSKSR